MGTYNGDSIICAYHGLQFGRGGRYKRIEVRLKSDAKAWMSVKA